MRIRDLHPRWIASLCIAFRANSVAIPPSKRLASAAPRRSRCSRVFVHGLLVVAAFPVAPSGCGDDPLAVQWTANPDTVQLYALSRPEPNLLSAFDFYNRIPKRLEAVTTGNRWDLVADVREGQFVWLPPGSLGISSDAALATLDDETFESAARAPSDTARYVRNEPIPIQFDRIYVIRTRRLQGGFSACNYYGKIEALEADPIAGTIRFQFDVNLVCNSLDLVPPE